MSESIKNELKLDGESFDGHLSFNQQAMYDRLHRGIEEYRSANSDIANRASLLLVASTAAFGAIAAIAVVPEHPSELSLIPSFIASVISLALVLIAGSLWVPRASIIAGNDDIEAMYRNYISKNADDAFFLVMRDAVSVYKTEKSQNAPRANRLFWMTIGLDVQIIMLMASLSIAVLS